MDAAALMTAVDEAGAIAAGDARAAGAIAVPAAICHHRNMLPRGPLIRVRANRSHTNRLHWDSSRSFSRGSRWQNIRTASRPLRLRLLRKPLRIRQHSDWNHQSRQLNPHRNRRRVKLRLACLLRFMRRLRLQLLPRANPRPKRQSPRPCHQPKNFFARCRWFLRNRSSNR